LPKKPSEVEVRVLKEMFEASVDGQAYDTDRWGQYFRPAGVAAPSGSGVSASDVDAAEESFKAPAPKPMAKPAPVAESNPFEDEDDVASAPVAAAKPAQKAEDILALIRSRQKT
jgi:hypothetical protein